MQRRKSSELISSEERVTEKGKGSQKEGEVKSFRCLSSPSIANFARHFHPFYLNFTREARGETLRSSISFPLALPHSISEELSSSFPTSSSPLLLSLSLAPPPSAQTELPAFQLDRRICTVPQSRRAFVLLSPLFLSPPPLSPWLPLESRIIIR